MAPTGERDPSNEPFTTTWDGSKFIVHKLDMLLDDVARADSDEGLGLYDRGDFSDPIHRMRISAHLHDVQGEYALGLTTKIELVDAVNLRQQPLLDRFGYYFPNTDNLNFRYPYQILPEVFDNAYRLLGNNTKSMLSIDLEHGHILLANNLVLSDKERRASVWAPILGTISVESQLAAHLQKTAIVADFLNGFRETEVPGVFGIPIGRVYELNQDSSEANTTRTTGRHARKQPLQATFVSPEDTPREEPNLDAPPEREMPQSPEESFELWDRDLGAALIEPDKAPSLEDVGGLHEIKRQLGDIALSFLNPEIMEMWDAKRPVGLLFYGPPGTGKTMLAKALARTIDANVVVVQGTDIYEKWLGKSEEKMKKLFSSARSQARKGPKPVLLFFDEIESIIGISEAHGSADNARNAVAGIFKQEMTDLAESGDDVLVVGATNEHDALNPSLIRSGRFDYKLYIPLPDQKSREEIARGMVAKAQARAIIKNFQAFEDTINFSEIAAHTEEFSGADLAEVFRRLRMARAMTQARTRVAPPPITHNEIVQTIREFRQE